MQFDSPTCLNAPEEVTHAALIEDVVVVKPRDCTKEICTAAVMLIHCSRPAKPSKGAGDAREEIDWSSKTQV